MNDRNRKNAKILLLIPIIVFIVIGICMAPLTIDYFSTGSDVSAIALILIGSLRLIFTTVPCLVMSVFGTVCAVKVQKADADRSRLLPLIGILEIVVYGIGVICTIVAVFLSIIAFQRW